MKMKKRLAVILAFALAFTMSMSSVAFAAEGDGYLALGSDLSESERNTVMDLLGVDDPENYNVIYVTNAEEHKYLDSYVDTDQIGSRALSSVLIKEQGGSDIDVEIHNIGYCTEGMYRNALQTAGVEGAEVVVAGPFEISGTAALVGTIKAYEEMSGEDVDDEVIEGAVDELTTTGEVGEELGDKGAERGGGVLHVEHLHVIVVRTVQFLQGRQLFQHGDLRVVVVILDQLGRKFTDIFSAELRLKYQERSSGNIQRALGECLVHRDRGESVAIDAALLT